LRCCLIPLARVLRGGLESTVQGRSSGGNGISLEGTYVRGNFIPNYSIQERGYIGKITGKGPSLKLEVPSGLHCSVRDPLITVSLCVHMRFIYRHFH
jgi:hypothetical protein